LLSEIYRPVKRIKKKLKIIRRWLKSNIKHRNIIRPMPLREFLNCKIEDDASINWTLRKPHMDLITNHGQLKKIADIIDYFKSGSILEDTKINYVYETDT
jgi:hypothetical protein